MLNNPEKVSENVPLEVRCYFVRERNALAVRGQFESLYVDYYLHLMQHDIRNDEQPDQWLKDGVAALTLHLASRPWGEAAAWTVNLQNPLLNLFVTGSNRQGNVTGRVFTEDVKKAGANQFISQLTNDGQPLRQSTVEFDAIDLFGVVEKYYRQSEQRPARYFRHDEEDFVMVTAQPDCDLAWFESLDDEAIRRLDEEEELSLLETRQYRFDCGCSAERIYPIIATMPESAISGLFDEEENAVAGCPRCGANFKLTREGLEAFQNPPAEN